MATKLDAFFIELTLRQANVASEIAKITRDLQEAAKAATGVELPLGTGIPAALGKVARGGEDSQKGLRRVADGLGDLAKNALGINGPLERVVDSLLTLGVGGVALGLVIAGLTVLIGKYKELTGAIEATRKENQAGVGALQSSVQSAADPNFTLVDQIAKSRVELSDLQTDLADLKKSQPTDLIGAILGTTKDKIADTESRIAALRKLIDSGQSLLDRTRDQQAEAAKAKLDSANQAAEQKQREVQQRRLQSLGSVAALEVELSTQVAAATGLLADQAQVALETFIKKAGDARAQISRDAPDLLPNFDAQFSKLLDLYNARLGGAKLADEVLGPVKDRVTEILAGLDQTVDPVDALYEAWAKVQSVLTGIAKDDPTRVQYLAQQKEITDAIAAAEAERAKSVDNSSDGIIEQLDNQVTITKYGKEYLKLLEQQGTEQDDSDEATKKAAAERLQAARAQAQTIDQSVRGALQLASAFGLVDDATAKSLENISQIATSLITLSASIGTGNISGIISSSISVLGGLSGLFGESEASKRQKEVVKANTDAIIALTRKIGDLGGAVGQVSGNDLTSVQKAIAAAFAALNDPNVTSAQVRARVLDPKSSLGVPTLDAALKSLGLTLSDLTGVAKALGISFAGTTPTALELQQVLKALASAEPATFADDFAGQLAKLDAVFNVFDISDPIKQLQQFQSLFALLGLGSTGSPALTRATSGLDLSTSAGRAALQKNLEDVFQQILNGTLSTADLGGASAQQLLDQIEKLLSLVRNADQQTGTSQSFSVNRTITEATGTQQLAYLSTQTVLLQSIDSSVTAILGRLGGSIAAGGPLLPPVTSVTGFPAGSVPISTIAELNIAPGAVQVNIPAIAGGVTPEMLKSALTTDVVAEIGRKIVAQAQTQLRIAGSLGS